MMKMLRLTAVWLACLILNAQAQISFTLSGTSTNSFTALPTLSSGWSTVSVMPNAHSNIMTAEQLALAVQTNSASYVSNALGQSGTTNPTPSMNAIARWNTNNQNLQTRVTGNSYTLLMATLENDTGAELSAITVSYDYAAIVAADGSWIQEEVPGYMAYYSLSGAPDSWVLIPELSTNGNPQVPINLSVTLELNQPWLAGSNLFILWADDNAVAAGDTAGQAHEGCYTIDNFSAGLVEGALRVTATPASQTAAQCSTAMFSAHVMGGTPPYLFQWYLNDTMNPLADATNATLLLSDVQQQDAGRYFVVVQDSTSGGAQMTNSEPCDLSVVLETAPVILSALGDADLHTIHVNFSEPIQISSANGGDFAVQTPDGASTLTLTSSVVTNGTNVILTTAEARYLRNYVVMVRGGGIHTLCSGLSAPDGNAAPLVSQFAVIGLGDNTGWLYRADGVDPGADWMKPGIELAAWSAGTAAFDGKSGSNRVYITDSATGTQVPVQTHLPLTSTNYHSGQLDIPSYYFRTTFNLSGDPTNSSLSLTTFFDDSGVVFLNGQEVWRRRVTNDTSGQLSFDLYCPLQPSSDADIEGPFSIPLTNIVFGENLLAVCLKQANTNSSDITMALSLTAIVSNFVTGPLQVTAAITPGNGTVGQCGTASFQATAVGGTPPYQYQWYKDTTSSPVSGGTDASLVLANLQPSQDGNYFVVVTDSTSGTPQQVQSSTLNLVVVPESMPELLGALGETNLHTIRVAFSKPITLSATGEHFQVQAQDGSGNLTMASAVVTNGTNVLLTTAEARALKNYKVVVADGVTGCAGAVPTGTFVPLASQFGVIGLSDNTAWNYRADGEDPGSDWMLPGINLANWASGLAVFDGKRGSNRAYITITNLALDVPVQTQLSLTNLSYQTGQADIPSYYFRTPFDFPGDPAQSTLSLVTFFDDGGVVFLNGQEAWWLRVTNDIANQLSFNLYCPIQPSSDAALEGPFNLPLTNVVNGQNLMAVCLKQVNSSSSDITMGLSLVATVTNFPVVVTKPTLIVTLMDGGQIELAWLQSGVTFTLQATSAVQDSSSWAQVTEADNPSGGYHRVRANTSNDYRFFRLYKQ